jgi:hypothetical protein
MKYVVEMGSGSMMHIPSFMKTDPGIQKSTDRGGGRGYTDT